MFRRAIQRFFEIAYRCHRRPDRSFHCCNKQFPICARCTGITVGYFLAGIWFIFSTPLSFTWSIILVLPTTIDGVGQLFERWESTNSRRFVTGILAGVGIVFLIFHYIMWGFTTGQYFARMYLK